MRISEQNVENLRELSKHYPHLLAARLFPPVLETTNDNNDGGTADNGNDDENEVPMKYRRAGARSKANLAGLWGVPS